MYLALYYGKIKTQISYTLYLYYLFIYLFQIYSADILDEEPLFCWILYKKIIILPILFYLAVSFLTIIALLVCPHSSTLIGNTRLPK